MVVAVVGVLAAYAANWHRLRQSANHAWTELERMQAAYDAGVEVWTAPIEAHRNWCLAENSVPFTDRKSVCQSYLDFINRFQDRMKWFFEMALHDELESARRELEHRILKIEEYRQEAKQWLAAGSASGKSSVIHSITDNRTEQ